MRARLLLLFKRLWRKPGVRISAFGAVALGIAILAPLIDRSIPEALIQRFSREAVLPILNILASSMLAVTTFSLGIMVSAFRSAAGQATPRAYRILMQDMTTLNVMSVFVGAFLFSLVAIVMFRAEFYGDSAAVIVFAMTLVCIVLIIIAILRWIAHLSQLGSLDHTLALVEDYACPPLHRLAKTPNLGARAAKDAPRVASSAAPVMSKKSGYVQYVSLGELNDAMEEADGTIWVTTPPGKWVLAGMPLGYASGVKDADALATHFTIGAERTAEQDARFGIVILSEIASRALSPGVNDPGTAIDVVHRVERILWDLGQRMTSEDCETETRYEHVIIGSVAASDLLQDGLSALMQDGGNRFDVMAQVLKATNRLSKSDWTELAEAAKTSRDTALGIIDRRIDDSGTVEALRKKAKQTA